MIEIDNKYSIDVSKLNIGQTFKNTKAMCKYLEQPYITGSKTSRESQLKEWRRYIDWEKDGQKIIITDIYPSPLDKADGRVTNGTQKYQRFIEDILLSYMTSEINKQQSVDGNSDYQFLFTLNGIALICKMINDKYIRKDIYKVLEGEGYSPFNIKDFFSRTELKFSIIINNALRNMEKRKLINYNKVLIVKENGKQRTADFHDENEFLNMERLTLNMLGFESVTEMYLRNKAKEYYHLLDKNVKTHLGWEGCYKVFAINLNSRSIVLEREYLEKTNQTNKLELNQNLVNFFNTQADNKFIKSCKNELNGFKLPANYKKQQYGLSDYLLKMDNQ